MTITWNKINDLDTKLWEVKSMLSTCEDALYTEGGIRSPDFESIGAVLYISAQKVSEMQETVGGLFKDIRNDYTSSEDEDEDKAFWDSLRKSAREWPYKDPVGEPLEDGGGEDDSSGIFQEEVEEGDTEFTSSLDVKLKEEHPDGSATYTINADKDTMDKVFKTFFIQAVIEGIKSANMKSDEFIRRARVYDAAVALEKLLVEYELNEDFDYDPLIKAARQKLSEALHGKYDSFMA